MKYFVMIILLSMGTQAFAEKTASLRNENLNPTVDEAQMPGTPVPIEELQTSPNETPAENRSEKSRATLLNEKQLQEERVNLHEKPIEIQRDKDWE